MMQRFLHKISGFPKSQKPAVYHATLYPKTYSDILDTAPKYRLLAKAFVIVKKEKNYQKCI